MRHRLLVIVLLAGLGVTTSSSLAATPVSYPVLLREIESGPLIRAVINRTRGDIEIKFRNLSEWEAFYPPGAQPRLQSLLRRRHIRVIFASRPAVRTTKPKAVHHHLRYIAAGLLGALAVLGVAAFFYDRRRRTYASQGSAPPGSAPPGSAAPGSAASGSAASGSAASGSAASGSAASGSAASGSAPPGTAPPGSASPPG